MVEASLTKKAITMGIPIKANGLCSLFIVFITPCLATEKAEPLRSALQVKAASHFTQPFAGELDCENVGYAQIGEVEEHYFPIFKIYDHDNSQRISRKEWLGDPYIKDKALHKLSFSIMDKNNDGSATPGEMRIYLIDSLKLLDGDGDDDVFPDEFQHAYQTGTVLKNSTKQPLTTSAVNQAKHAKKVADKTAKGTTKHAAEEATVQ
ncbi:MAG: hypothetical protein KTR17_01205 [Cellvibrionaceae bacterium]|nr:hypothetical protein [Cellvibrionaceae bacterium]